MRAARGCYPRRMPNDPTGPPGGPPAGPGDPLREGGIATQTRRKVARPERYKVLLYNDDYTPMEFVVAILENIFGKGPSAATQIMLQIHNTGLGVGGVYVLEVAETKVAAVHAEAEQRGYPLRSGTEFAKLTEQWRLPRIGNVLTQIMMPIARTLAPEICIIGADGREQGESSFWKHDPASQIGDRMKDLQQCHPAFFAKRDYKAYYAEHCERLRAQIEMHESKGGSVSSLTPSFIPVLAERHVTVSE